LACRPRKAAAFRRPPHQNLLKNPAFKVGEF